MTELNPPTISPSTSTAGPQTVQGAPRVPPSAGGLLRAAREAAGMSLDTVAQQLKLAPRQVTALEDGDFAALPGRTFVRGFMRNYARLVRIDPDVVLAALAGRETPSLDSPALQPTAPTIGELPTAEYAKPGWTRWAIPLTLVAVIAAAAVYEFSRSHGDGRRPAGGTAETERSAAPTPAPANESALPNPAAAPAPGAATALPNPVAGTGAPAAPTPAADAQGAHAPAAAPEPAQPAATDAQLVLTYRESSWTEVKDSAGRLLISQMVPGGQTRTVTGAPPLELVLGNASAASVNFRGKPVDLAPYTRQKVARLVLQ